MVSLKAQHGQAMVFGLLFLAVVLLSMLMLFNRGMLIKDRVQLENAADAAAYSQAKLAARNMNFAAYTNRAMVANEVSVGQMVSLLSWAKHYKNVGAFTKYPAYRFPVAPPSPVTFSQVLGVVTLPYKVLGSVVEVPAKTMTKVWPTAISYFNGALGLFQQLFSLSTIAAQLEMNTEIIDAHQFDQADPEFYTPFIGWYFMAQNTMLTYAGEKFNTAHLNSALSTVEQVSANEDGIIADFLGGQTGELNNLIERNSPSTKRKYKGTAEIDPVVQSYQRYAAIVNRNREPFTADRHWDIWATTPDVIPEIRLDFGIVKLTIDLDFQVGFGLKNDGGTAYIAKKALETRKQIDSLGWSAIDVTSWGVEFDIALFVEIEICLPIVGCSSATLLDFSFELPIGFPLAGATHQLVSANTHAKRLLPQWGMIGDQDGPYGGDPEDDVNEGPLDAFHAQALIWGQIAPMLQPGGMYGARASMDVTPKYGGPPAFLFLGQNFQETRVSYEYVTAVAKSLDDVETTDNEDGLNIGNSEKSAPEDWDDGDIGLRRFEVDTHSRAGADDFAGAYQRTIWNDERPMMTISAAEAYFKNPMQIAEDDSEEPASLFSPFWDARLKEPSAISLLIASGEVDWEDLFEEIPGRAIELVNWLLNSMATTMVDQSVDYVLGKVQPPMDSLLEPWLEKGGDAAKEAAGGAVDSITDQLEPFVE